MDTRTFKTASFGAILGSFVALSPGHANIHPLSFEESVGGVFRQLYVPVESLRLRKAEQQSAEQKGPDVPYSRLLAVSESVFSFSPETAAELGHLEAVARAELISTDGWDQFSEFEETLRTNLRRKGVYFSPGMRRKIYMVGASMMWHQAQHIYDARIDGTADLPDGARPLVTAEGEMRGWRAGCLFWKAGEGLKSVMGSPAQADAFQCDGSFPESHYCRFRMAAELVVLTGARLQLGPESDPEGEALLAHYCAEFERGRKGNPLSMDGVPLEWSLARCMSNALQAIHEPGWQGSTERCVESDGKGPDLKHASWELGF